jgi:hypothetical protein
MQNAAKEDAAPKPAAQSAPLKKPSAPAAQPPAQYLAAMETLGQETPSIRSMLPKMIFAGIEEGVVTVEFGGDGIMVRRLIEAKLPIIEAALSDSFGTPMRLRTAAAGAAAPKKTSSAAKNVIEQSYEIFGRDKIDLTD